MITALTAANLSPGKTISDGNGLYLRCLSNGRKSWIIKKSVGGKMHTATIGAYPGMTIAEARRVARDHIAALALAGRPQAAAQATFGDVVREWLKFKEPQVTDVSKIACRMRILRPLDNLPFNAVTTLDVATIIKQYTHGGTEKLESASRLALWIRQCELFAMNSGYCENLRFQGLGGLVPPHRGAHRPSIEPSELPGVLKSLRQRAQRGAFGLWSALQMGLYTLLRPGEYTAMEWEWVKRDAIEIPAATMKMKKPHVVPVTPQIRRLLDDLERLKVNQFVLPSPVKVSAHITPESLEKFMRNAGYRGVLVPHGFRSIGRTWMRENGIEHDVAEMCLAHAVGSAVERAYNRADLMNERRDAMNKWDAFVAKCIDECVKRERE